MEQETKAQITEYIETKEKEVAQDSIIWPLSELKDEVASFVWKEEKEDDDGWRLFNLLKNDKKLLKYAEFKMNEENLKWWEKFRMDLLELRLSITCSYFKEFQAFLTQLKKWDDVWWNTENHVRLTPDSWYNWNLQDQFEDWLHWQEAISREKVMETWNYIKNWWMFYSPTLWNVTWWENEYKHVCSTWSYNVLWRLWLPKVSDSLNVDLNWTILTKMWLGYITSVDPDDPEKNWYVPRDWDTAVWPKFTRTSWKVTQHQATYINWHRVSDTIQNKMSCYNDENEPKNVRIYRYEWARIA